jgi:23S rRNA U2552 (ribose-2'-O)-methylase RlmE/FtsJ
MEAVPTVKPPPWQIDPSAWQCWKPVAPIPLEFGEWIDKSDSLLSEKKESITAYEENHKWELAKKMTNPYEMVYTHEDPHFHPSLCVLHPLSRSYFKMLEMLDVLQFYEQTIKHAPKVYTAHVAEGPGGFIQAVVDTCDYHRKILASAAAMTLKASDQRVPGWRRASAYLQKHKEIRLHYGADGTGDVYKPQNQVSFAQHAGLGVQLFTADGGFDFSIDYKHQEEHVYRLLVCSANTGLRVLGKGGCFVIKVFDIFSEPTKVFLTLLGRCFKEWMLYKPAISRPCNSERYFLGRGFRGASDATLEAFDLIQQKAEQNVYPTNDILLPSEREYLERWVAESTAQQIESIDTAIEYAKNPSIWYETTLPIHFRNSLNWCSRFHVPSMLRTPLLIKVRK